ncbi:hypothetical protein [Winogradskya humida]|uniref:hypothetical protein n=1 Tax=Winogradskya humida TaxID=113566 RepID=UPI0031D9E5EB
MADPGIRPHGFRGLDIRGLDSWGLDIRGLDSWGLDIRGLDSWGRAPIVEHAWRDCGQLILRTRAPLTSHMSGLGGSRAVQRGQPVADVARPVL